MFKGQRQLGRAREKNAMGNQQALKFGQCFRLRGTIKVDQQVAAKDKVVDRRAGETIVRQDVAALKMNKFPHGGVQEIAGLG